MNISEWIWERKDSFWVARGEKGSCREGAKASSKDWEPKHTCFEFHSWWSRLWKEDKKGTAWILSGHVRFL